MSDFVTVSRQDKNFKSYMLGKVPDNEGLLAVPVKGFNFDSFKEQVTFQIIEKSKRETPKLTTLSTQLIRYKWLTLTLTPVLCSYAYLYSQGFNFRSMDLFLIGLTILLSHSSIFMLNDFYDHIFGVDFVRPKGGSRIIQKAILPASQVRLWGGCCLGFAIALGLYLSYVYGLELIFIGATGIGIGWIYSYLTKFKRFIGLNAFIINMFMGPFLVLGFSYGVVRYSNLILLSMGLLFGLLAYLCISFRHFENLYFSKNKMGTSIVEYLGFDKSRTFLLLLFLLVPFVYMFVSFSFVEKFLEIKNLILLIPLIFYFPILFSILNIKSIMGSSIARLRDSMASFHCIIGLSITLYLLVK